MCSELGYIRSSVGVEIPPPRIVKYFFSLIRVQSSIMGKSSFSTCSKVVLAILLVTFWTVDAEKKFCTTDSCRIIGSELYFSRNQTVDECEDFYEHACGGWINNIHPVDSTSTISLTPNYILSEVVRQQVYDLLKEEKPNDIEAVVKAKKLFASCNDQEHIRNQGVASLIQVLVNNGDWPLSVTPNRWNPLNLAWQNIHETIADTQAVSALFDIDVEIDRKDSKAHILSFTVPKVPSRRGKRSQAYRQYLRGAAELIKSLRSPTSYISASDFDKDIDDLIIFEAKLSKLTKSRQQTDEVDSLEHRVITIEKLQQEWDEIVNVAPSTHKDYSVDWLDVISERFFYRAVWINKSEKIALRPGNVIQELAKLLTETPVRTIVNFIQWKLVHSLLPLTSHGLEDTDQWNLDNAAPSRQDYCVVTHPMPLAISHLYSKEYLNETSKAVALDMVDRIREELKLEITGTRWIDDGAKITVKEKLDAMKIIIGNADWVSDVGKLNAYYGLFRVGDDYFENMVAYRRFNVNKRHTRLRIPVSEEDIPFEFFQSRGPFTWYDYQTNALTIGAQNFQNPVYMEGRPTSLNFASLGTIIAHEMAHSVDTVGRLYDQLSNKHRWWTDTTIDNYKRKARCFAQQFRSYTLDKKPLQQRVIKVKGELTHAENIADTVGVRAALRAFQKMRAEGKIKANTLHLLNQYSSDDLFFYGYASSMCESIARRMLPFYYKNSKRTPNRWRVNGALTNLKEFAEAFHCQPTDPMNPSSKCLLWD